MLSRNGGGVFRTLLDTRQTGFEDGATWGFPTITKTISGVPSPPSFFVMGNLWSSCAIVFISSSDRKTNNSSLDVKISRRMCCYLGMEPLHSK